MRRSTPSATTIRTVGAAGLAALLSVAVVVAQHAANHEYPLGDRSRGYDDYFAQFVPFHAMLRELLHGSPAIDAQFNWFVALGQPFLPDYAVYLGGPWTLLIGLFPLTRVELGMFVITLLKVATVAVAMVVYLRIAHGAGHPLWAAALGTAYATGGFVLEEGLFDPMWLEGVAAFPVFALVGHWSRDGRRPVLSILLVALFFWGNFYTAVMAAVGAGYLTVVMAVVDRTRPRVLVGQLGRFALRGALGVGLSLPVVLPGVLAGLHAPPLDLTFGPRDVPLARYLGRLFSLTELLDWSPGLGVGTVLLVAVVAFFVSRPVPVRERAALGAALALMVTTMAWGTTRGIWYGFTEPHGSYFRNAFLVSGLLVVIAWRFLLRPQPQPVATALGGAAVLVLLAGLAVTHRRGPHHPLSTEVVAAVVLVTVAMAVLAAARPATRRAAGGILVAALVLELAVNAVVVEQLRSGPRSPQGSWWADADRDLAAVQQHRQAGQGWPPYRLDAAMYRYGHPSGLLGEPGVRYYSSTFSRQSTRVFADLGVPSGANGRRMGTDEDVPVLQLMSVSGRLVHGGPTGVALTWYDALPLVRVAGPVRAPVPGMAPVFAVRDALWDEQVYSAPTWTTRPAAASAGLAAGTTARLAGGCPAGGLLQADLRPLRGAVILTPTAGDGPSQRRAAPAAQDVVAPLTLPVSADGHFDLTYAADDGAQQLDLDRFACYDAVRAGRLVATARGTAPRLTVRGRDLAAGWDRPVTGDVIVSTTAVDGWSCTADGHPARIVPRSGLLAVPVAGATRLTCRYTTPGLAAALAGAGAAALLTVGLAALGRTRGPAGRRAGRRDGRSR